MASIKELLSAMISKINGKNEGVNWNENDPESPAFVKNRPFYDTRKFSQKIEFEGKSITLCKISDNVPEQISGVETVNLWAVFGSNADNSSMPIVQLSENIYAVSNGIPYVVIATSDGAYESSTPFGIGPLERGVYFLHMGDDIGYVSGISFTSADTPEITWDGDMGVLKKIDPKYISTITAIITYDGTNYTANCTFNEFAELIDNGANVIMKNRSDGRYVITRASEIQKDSDTQFTIYFGSHFAVNFIPTGVVLIEM